jgi:hypothetical protein
MDKWLVFLDFVHHLMFLAEHYISETIYFHPMMEKCVGSTLSKTHYKELISASLKTEAGTFF